MIPPRILIEDFFKKNKKKNRFYKLGNTNPFISRIFVGQVIDESTENRWNLTIIVQGGKIISRLHMMSCKERILTLP